MPQSVSWKRRLKNFLFIDLKTVAGEASLLSADPRLQRQWEEKIRHFRNEDDLSAAAWYDRRASYYAEFGKIIAVGIGGLYFTDDDQPRLKVKVLANDDEKALLDELLVILNRYPAGELTLCAHNGKEFDFPYLCRRLMANGLPLPHALQISGKKPWEITHQDTLERWQFGDKRHFVPLDLLAAVLDVPTRPLEWQGDRTSEVYYREHDWPRIEQYTQDSVVMLVQVYMRMVGAPLVADEHIVVSE
ncbi:ribonuclease H-like domain-containing protein [Spirosoma sp. KUDC1026]|uniref:ribonuclease H-like domain-containing protein n=1 Tax=Spirosoma sp. KUDC1026 TaxID=2745947 RepID=UPI00159BD9B7|nr:ribonuclease H-like domain-containing protein [Spirosoma sp. KUDC1026]QKZ11282.1 3'-5' exonuclease [Spirosoma sp. KUDC1026]